MMQKIKKITQVAIFKAKEHLKANIVKNISATNEAPLQFPD